MYKKNSLYCNYKQLLDEGAEPSIGIVSGITL